ncbi:MAG: DUF2070 family protein [Candidatus Micrarchaeota archaeon]|nr:DUF2070 family protein [Candidatus Micrarchaeota archaeon]
METAKQTIGLSKYFLTLPSTSKIIFYIIISSIIGGLIIDYLITKEMNPSTIFYSAGLSFISFIFPTIFSAIILKVFRKKVKTNQAFFLSFLSLLIYLFFIFLTYLFYNIIGQSAYNFIFIGFGFSFLLWLFVLNLIFGLKRSGFIFSVVQLIVYFFSFSFGFSFIKMEEQQIILKIFISLLSIFLIGYLFLYLISRPLKKNLKVSSNQMIEMFFSQWLYKQNDLEEALDELGQEIKTWIAVASFKTKKKNIHFVVPYFHFGPFGNLGGSEFPAKVEEYLKTYKDYIVVFHGTATHSLDPVSSSSLENINQKIKQMIQKIKYKTAYFGFKQQSYQNSICYLFEINQFMIAAFSRAPHSTEDINLAIGWALMEKMKKKAKEAIVIDCHNSETEEIDYIEPGSPVSFEMEKALEKCLKQKSLLTKLKIGLSTFYPTDIQGIASGGIKAVCIEGENKRAIFLIVFDSNSILPFLREEIIKQIKQEFKDCLAVEVFTTDTHQLSTISRVFNTPATEPEQQQKIIEICLNLAKEAYKDLEYAEFGMIKEEIELKVIGPYQTVEIVSTINSVLAILKILFPTIIIGAILFLLWFLNKI